MTHGAGINSSVLGNRSRLQYAPLTARFRTNTIGPSGMLFGILGPFRDIKRPVNSVDKERMEERTESALLANQNTHFSADSPLLQGPKKTILKMR